MYEPLMFQAMSPPSLDALTSRFSNSAAPGSMERLPATTARTPSRSADEEPLLFVDVRRTPELARAPAKRRYAQSGDCMNAGSKAGGTSTAPTRCNRLQTAATRCHRLQPARLCGRCVVRIGEPAEAGNRKCRFAGSFRDGSDGTRTRDLRRDRLGAVEFSRHLAEAESVTKPNELANGPHKCRLTLMRTCQTLANVSPNAPSGTDDTRCAPETVL
jgi:hypothetical protein